MYLLTFTRYQFGTVFVLLVKSVIQSFTGQVYPTSGAVWFHWLQYTTQSTYLHTTVHMISLELTVRLDLGKESLCDNMI